MSSALREKSGILMKTNASHTHASDVFEEMSHQCHMPYKTLICNQDMHVSQLMQVINGAAMARFWVFFEHIDNLPLVNFQIILKEIQMVQQQYIIAELGDFDVAAENEVMSKAMHIAENKNSKGDLTVAMKDPQVLDKASSLIPNNNLSSKITGSLRPSLGIFGSISSHMIVRYPDVADNINLQAQSSFRTLSLAKPDFHTILKMILKSEGYQSYDKLAKLTTIFLENFTSKKNATLYGSDATPKMIERHAETLVVSDLRIAVRFSILLRDQEWSGYLDNHFAFQRKERKFELQLHAKKAHELTDQVAFEARQRRLAKLAKEKIEMEAMKEGVRLTLKQKFFNEWRAAK